MVFDLGDPSGSITLYGVPVDYSITYYCKFDSLIGTG